MNIVLHEPGIALNTGNIGRSCAATDSSLHLIRPYGFHISEKEIKRAGMDYWDKIDLHEYIDYEDFLERHPEISFGGEREKTGAESSEAYNRSIRAARPQNKITRRTVMLQGSGLLQPRRIMHIPRYVSDRTIISCSATNQEVYRRRYLYNTRMPAYVYRCGEIYVPLILPIRQQSYCMRHCVRMALRTWKDTESYTDCTGSKKQSVINR